MKPGTRKPPHSAERIGVTAALVAFNWLVFVWAVSNNQVLTTSLGHVVAFGCIWFALGMVSTESVIRARRLTMP